MDVLEVIWHGLRDSFLMAWAVWWALVLGFAISAIVQAWVPRERIERALSGSGPKPVTLATGLGAASSSCSYAAIAIAKSLFQKGASATTALAFQFASTNLVWELGLVLWVLIGWQFTLAEYLGGLVMIALMAVLLRVFVSPRLEADAREHAQQADTGHQHHTAGERMSWRQRLSSTSAWSDVAHNFRGDWQMLYKEIAVGFLLAGFIAQLGNDFFNGLFLEHTGGALGAARERDRRPDHRHAELRLLGRQRAARRGAVVGRDQLRRGAGVHLRRPDRAADHRDLPQVLRHALHAPDRRADVRDDGHSRADRRRAVQRPRADPHRAAALARATSSARSPSTTSCSSTCSALAIFAALFWLTHRRGATDPMCGMKVDKAKAIRMDFGEQSSTSAQSTACTPSRSMPKPTRASHLLPIRRRWPMPTPIDERYAPAAERAARSLRSAGSVSKTLRSAHASCDGHGRPARRPARARPRQAQMLDTSRPVPCSRLFAWS